MVLRVTRTEHGTLHDHEYEAKYEDTYTQPIHNYIISWLYLQWLGLTSHIWGNLEKRKSWNFFENEIPYTIRQELRYYRLCHKNRIRIDYKIVGWSTNNE